MSTTILPTGTPGISPSVAPAGAPAGAPRRPSEAERRSALVQAAEEVFLHHGYAAANMDDVAQAVGMSKKTLYQLFPSKEALFDAVVTRFCAPMQVAADATALPGDAAALTRMLAEVAAHILTERHVALFRVIASEVKRAPELAAAVQRSRGRGTGLVEGWLQTQAEAGWLDIEDPAEVAGMLIGMVIGEPHLLMLIGQRSPPDAAEIDRRARLAVGMFIGGATRRPGGSGPRTD